MRFLKALRITLGGVLAAGLVMTTAIPGQCTEEWYDDTNFEEHIEKVRKSWRLSAMRFIALMMAKAHRVRALGERTIPAWKNIFRNIISRLKPLDIRQIIILAQMGARSLVQLELETVHLQRLQKSVITAILQVLQRKPPV